jgi:hypothetical protein
MEGTNSPAPITRAIENVRPVKLKGTDPAEPAVYALADDRTFDAAAHEELSADEQDVARKALKALAEAEA